MELLAPCREPDNAGQALEFMDGGEFEKAAEAYVRYVLDVRDAIELCDARFAALRKYYEELSR